MQHFKPMENLDSASRLRLRGFGFKLLLVVPISVLFAAAHHIPPLQAAGFFCLWYAMFAALVGLAQQHRFRVVGITAWDEAAAVVALGVTARFLSSFGG